MSLEPKQAKAAVEVVKAAQSCSVPKEHVDDLRIQKWKDNDWTRMLGAAPVCLELLGSCCLVSSTSVANTTEINPPPGGFKYLKGYRFLTAALVEVSNRGDTAFRLASKNMARIGENSKNVKRNVVNLFKMLRAPDFNGFAMEIELETLKDVANQCVQDSKEMDDEFTTWLNFIMELHEVCQNEQSRGEKLFQDIASEEQSQKRYQEEQEKMLKEHQAKVKEMEDKVKEARELYEKLHKDFPDGDSLMKQQLIMLAGETVSSLLKVGATALAVSANPLSAIPLAGDAAKDLTDKLGDKGSKGSGKKGKKDTGDKADDKQTTVTKTEAEPALARCSTILTAIEALDEILDDTVDWERILPESKDDEDESESEGASEEDEKEKPKENGNKGTKRAKATESKSKKGKRSKKEPKLGIIAVETMLAQTDKFIKKSPRESKSSGGKKLVSIIKDTTKVVGQMKAEREKAGNVKEWKKPADDSSLVKGWRKAVTKSLQSTMNLQAKFKASGGGVANRPHMIFKVDDNQKAQIDARKDLTRATIENAKAHLQIALEGYLAQQETARKMNESTLRMQQEMATVRRELAQLDQKKITLEEVRRVLRDCIAFLIQLKAKVKELTMFFSQVAVLISSAVATQVKPFARYIQGAADQRIQGSFVGETTINIIMQYALDVAANFALYDDIADMYMTVNDKHILTGLRMVDEMGKQSTKDQLEEKKKQLQEYSESASKGIIEIINKKTEQVCAGSQKRAQEIQELLAQPDLPPSRRLGDSDVIKEGAEESTIENQVDIEVQNSALNYLSQPKEVRDENKQSLANATNPKYLEEIRRKQEGASDVIDSDDDY